MGLWGWGVGVCGAPASRNADHELPGRVLLELESLPVGPLANMHDRRRLMT